MVASRCGGYSVQLAMEHLSTMTLLPRSAVLVVLSVLLAACSEEPPVDKTVPETVAESTPTVPPEPKAPPMREVTKASTPPPSLEPWLRAHLPPDALAYVRIPSFWGMLGTPKGSMYDRALGSAPYVEAVENIREGFGENVLPELPADSQFLLQLLILHARSPLEAAVIPPAMAEAPFPDLLFTVALDFADTTALNAFLAQSAQSFPMLQVMQPVDEQGNGVLAISNLPVSIRYSSSDSRLYLYASMVPDFSVLGALLDNSQPSHQKMTAVESKLDASGQGLFVWTDIPRALQMMQTTQPDGSAAMLMALGVGEAQSIGLGVGTTGGIHRMKILLEMPAVGFRLFVPTMRSKVEFEAAGVPDSVAVFGLPDADDLSSMEQGLVTLLDSDQLETYLSGKKKLAERLGFTLEELLDTVGQDFLVVFDEAGQYAALRLQDPERFDAMLQRTVEQFGALHEQREIAGQTIHHVSMRAFTKESLDDYDGAADLSALDKRLLGMPRHLYWVHDGDYLVASGTPQPLIDRHYILERTPLVTWMAEEQRVDPEGALLLATTRTGGMPTLMYNLNLQLIATLGDLTDQPVDLFEFPSARELGLPDEGAYSLRIASTSTELSAELVFEHNPLELLSVGGGYGGVMALGVLAAVAVPAYQDYTIRAKVQEGVLLASPARTALGIACSENAFLQRPDNYGLGLQAPSAYGENSEVVQSIEARVLGSTISEVAITYRALGSEVPDGAQVIFIGECEAGLMTWTITTNADMPEKFRPRG